jgi:hypothetical protein
MTLFLGKKEEKSFDVDEQKVISSSSLDDT